MSWLLVAAPAAPLLGALLAVLWRRAAGPAVVGSCALALISLLVLLAAHPGGALSSAALPEVSATWARVGGLELALGLWFDGLSIVTSILVASLGLVVSAYAVPYMRGRRSPAAFFAWLGVFVGGMLALVLSSSLVLLFFSWELVGLASFALIGFHHEEAAARRGARRAFLVTRTGDVGLLLAWLLLWQAAGTTGIEAALAAANAGAVAVPVALIAALVVLAALGKSAQLPFSIWLPDAMVGPTPVSALLHSATMVAAGVYLLARLFPLLEAAPAVRWTLAGIGLATALFAALVATQAEDAKRVLAWSTVSHLGEMMLALGLASPLAATFFLVVHAVFKASLFLVVGAVEHGAGSRELSSLSGVGRAMPITGALLVISGLALAGVPPLAGFFGEEEVLSAAVAHGFGWALSLLVVVALAGLYISRLVAVVVLGAPAKRWKVHDVGPSWLVPMTLLALGSVVVGFVLREPVQRLLGFSAEAPAGWGWRGAAIAVSLGAVVLGTASVAERGAAPLLGRWPIFLELAADAVVRGVAASGIRLAAGINLIEDGLDLVARGIGRGVLSLASWLPEAGFDESARGIARTTLSAARGVDGLERFGFGIGGDAFAGGFRVAGGALRRVQTGRIYQYTTGLFAWVLLAGLVAVLLTL